MNLDQEIKAVVFDLDGVVIDSFNAWYIAFNRTLAKYGKCLLSKEEFWKQNWIQGRGLEIAMKKMNLDDDAVDYCYSSFENNLDNIELPSSVIDVLSSIDRKLGLVTNTNSRLTKKILGHFGILDHFDVIVGGDQVENKKPSSEPLLKASERLGVDPWEILFVGDTESDVLAGEKAGCKVIGIGVEGDFKVEYFEDLPDAFSGFNL